MIAEKDLKSKHAVSGQDITDFCIEYMFNKNKVCRGFLDGVCPECPLFLFREHLLNTQPDSTEVKA